MRDVAQILYNVEDMRGKVWTMEAQSDVLFLMSSNQIENCSSNKIRTI